MKINSNNLSLNSYKYYKNYNKEIFVYNNRISSGEKISKPKDDPIGFYKSQIKEQEIRSLNSGNKNIQDEISILQIQDSALEGISNMSNKMRELVLQAKSGVNSKDEEEIIQKEIDSIKESINDLINNTEFNGKKILKNDNKLETINLQTGLDITTDIPVINLSVDKLGVYNGNSLKDININTEEGLDYSLDVIDKSLTEISDMRTKMGSINNVLDNTLDYVTKKSDLATQIKSKIKDTDIAREMINYTKSNIMMNASINTIAQSNSLSKQALSILKNAL